jgi:hypothetical protein
VEFAPLWFFADNFYNFSEGAVLSHFVEFFQIGCFLCSLEGIIGCVFASDKDLDFTEGSVAGQFCLVADRAGKFVLAQAGLEQVELCA